MKRALCATLLVLLCTGFAARASMPSMRIEASARAADGTILVAGQSTAADPTRTLLVGRLNADGTVDATFGSGGWASYADTSPATLEFSVTAVAIDSSGGVAVATRHDGQLALLRFTSSGQPDYGFGMGGFALDGFSLPGERIDALRYASDGTLIAIGSATGGAASPSAMLLRYWPWGSRDTGFGSGPNGESVFTFGPGDSELRAIAPAPAPDTGFYAVGYARGNGGDKATLLARFNDSGALDYGFPAAVQDFAPGIDDEAFGVSTDSQGRILVVGREAYEFNGQPQWYMMLARFQAWGGLDSSFSYDGWTFSPEVQNFSRFDDSASTALAVIEDASGRLDVLGTSLEVSTNLAHFAIWTFDPASNAQSGPLALPLGDTDDEMSAAYAAPSGQIVAVGTRASAQGESALRVRYFADDGSFDTDFALEGADDVPNAFALDSAWGADPAQEVDGRFRVSGIDVPVSISVANGEYSLDCQAYTSAAGTVTNGQWVCVRAFAATTPDTVTDVQVNVGAISSGFSITTGNVPDTGLASTPPNPSGATVSFSVGYRGQYPATGFECSLDGAAFTSCGNGYAQYTVADGSHTFQARALNGWGADPTPASYTWTAQVPPDTTLVATPDAVSTTSSPGFTFASNDPNATFRCKLDMGPTTVCASPQGYTQQVDGSHTFSVYAVAASGVADATPATYTWTIDAVPPDTQLDFFPAGLFGGYSNSSTATFRFSSGDPQLAGFECSLDAGAFASCASPVSYTLADGSHTFKVRAKSAGQVDPTPVVYTWTIDTITPDVAITGGPAVTAGDSASFTFASSDPAAHFFCWVDSGAITSCTSPFAATASTDGVHTFRVQAYDDANNQSAWISRQWTRDTVAPDTTITSGPQPVTQSAGATFTLAANESGASFQCRLDGGAWSACSAGGVTYSNLPQGQHAFDARAVDLAGNVDPTPASQAWTVDYNYGPDTSITGGPSGTVSATQATFTFTSDVAGSTFQCAWDGGAWVACSSPAAMAGLADGSHTFAVAATDPYGNVDRSPAAVSWTVDTVSPDTSITSAPSGTVAQADATIAFASSDPSAGFECRLDGGAFAACATPVSLAGLADGTHTFEVRAKDFAGNLDASPASATWAVDTTAPNTLISSGPAVNANQAGATFQFDSGEAGDTYQCSLDGAAFSACASPVGYAGLADGAHTFQVRAVDPYGNVDASPASWNWSIDTVAPDTSITSGPSGRNNSSTATFGLASTEANATFQCQLDAGSFLACASPVTYSGLAHGSHTFQVRSVDVAGNVDPSPASRSWSVK